MIISANNKTAGKYSPIPVGNGDLSLMIDYTGSNDATPPVYSLHRAGVRQQKTNTLLFPFGRITQKFCGNDSEITAWQQSINTANGLIQCRAEYKNGIAVESEVFCHLKRNIIAFRKNIRNSTGSCSFRFECGNAPRMNFAPVENGLDYFFDGIAEYRGAIRFYSDAPFRTAYGNGIFSLITERHDFTLFLCIDDDPGSLSFDELLADSAKLWEEYHAESFIDVPDPEIMKTYEISKYHLRINQTRWSMPVGLFNTHFGGRYFAFDEFFCAHALASCGHFGMLKKIVEFRFSCLPWARYRANGYYHDARPGARWEWETLENFEEGSLCGHWQDHIFHMAHIALETWYYCRYSGDSAWLREKGVKIIEACAEFYMDQAIINLPDRRKIITKCTDLERFGAGRENAYLTTCSVMATLKIAAECFAELSLRPERAQKYLETAEALRESLPGNEQLYFAIPANDQKSVAVLGGIYPYDNVMGLEDEKQLRSIFDFMENDAVFGSMYPGVEAKLCRWYAGWESIVLSRLGKTQMALECLTSRAEKTGVFGQIYELIAGDRPWFATGEGIFIQAVNELLMPNSDAANAGAADALWKRYSFKLRSRSGETVTR